MFENNKKKFREKIIKNAQDGNHKESLRAAISAIVKTCEQAEVSPIKFNQGVCDVGINSFDILLSNIHELN